MILKTLLLSYTEALVSTRWLQPAIIHSSNLELTAGAASIALNPPPGVSLAGYGGGARRQWFGSQSQYAHLLTPSRGVHDEVRSKAIVLSCVSFYGSSLGDKVQHATVWLLRGLAAD